MEDSRCSAHSGQKPVFALLLILCTAALWNVYAQPKPVAQPSRAKDAATLSVLDVLRVRADGDAAQAVVTLPPGPVHRYTCDLVIIGAGMGGVSAAHEAARAGLRVCMTEPTLWIGGQMTSEGVSAFDDNKWIDSTGATATYLELSNRIRAIYKAKMPADKIAGSQPFLPLNPGNCWVSHLCFEPRQGAEALQSMLQPFIAAGRLTIWLHTVPVQVVRNKRTVESVLAYDFAHHAWLRLQGKYFIDASEWGDGIRLSGLPFRVGAEASSDTGERDAPEQADPNAIQSFTYPFILLNPRKPSIVPQNGPPPGYNRLKGAFTLAVDYGNGRVPTYGVFARRPGTPGSFWAYRRSVDAAQFRPGAFAGDLSMINWNSNDQCDARLLSGDPLAQAAALQGAKRLSLAFAWWLQHDVERDDGTGRGYPALQLEAVAMGSEDGLSQQPYIRESRRILALRTIVEEDIAVDFQQGARAALYPDTVGVGQYPIDSHSCGRNDFRSNSRPFEIPLGALIAHDADNLLAASKNIGTTHITNGAYRLHPTEWSIGEAAGAAVVWSLRHKTTPAAIDRNPAAIAALQLWLLRQGHPIFWFDDGSPSSTWFTAAQSISARGWLPADSSTLHFAPASLLSGDAILAALQRAGVFNRLTAESARALQEETDPTWDDLRKVGLKIAGERGKVTRRDFSVWLLSLAAGH
jgi:hypothetical protein